VGPTEAQAKRKLLERLRDRVRVAGSHELQPDSIVADAARLWFDELGKSDKAPRTKQTYRETWERYLVKTVGSLRLCDVRVSTVNRVITSFRDNTGRGAATHCKVVLSGIMALAVRHDAIPDNPVRELASLGQRSRKKERRVNVANIGEVLGLFHGSDLAGRWDLADMVDVLSGVGCRIGELLALDWSCIDFGAGTITSKERLSVSPVRASSCRTTPKPVRVCARSGRRGGSWTYSNGGTSSPFRSGCSPRALAACETPATRPRNSARLLPEHHSKGLVPTTSGITSFRHYVADALDRAGLSAREIADYLGHEGISTTQETYMERGVVGERAGSALGERPPLETKDVG